MIGLCTVGAQPDQAVCRPHGGDVRVPGGHQEDHHRRDWQYHGVYEEPMQHITQRY